MEKVKKIVLLICLMFFAVPLSIMAEETVDSDETTFDWNPVMDAIIDVESGGNKNAVSGNSVGVMQITPVLVKECNNILRRKKSKKRFRLSDRFSIAKSKEMFLIFQSYFNPTNDVEKAIRSWNGGLHYSIQRTQRYFNKVMNALK